MDGRLGETNNSDVISFCVAMRKTLGMIVHAVQVCLSAYVRVRCRRMLMPGGTPFWGFMQASDILNVY